MITIIRNCRDKEVVMATKKSLWRDNISRKCSDIGRYVEKEVVTGGLARDYYHQELYIQMYLLQGDSKFMGTQC